MNVAHFAYHTPQTKQFEEHYYDYVTLPIPIHFLYDEFLNTMQRYGKPMFKIPAQYTTIKKEIIFIFEIKHPVPNSDIYYYKHVVAEKKILKQYTP